MTDTPRPASEVTAHGASVASTAVAAHRPSQVPPVPPAPRRPTLSARLTDGGRIVLFLAGGAFLGAHGTGGATSDLCAAASALFVVLLAVSLLVAWYRTRGLRAGPTPGATAFAGEAFVVPVPFRNLGPGSALDLVVSMGGEHPRPGAFVAEIRGGTEQEVEVVAPALRRGRHPLGFVEVLTTHPLGLVEVRRRFPLDGDALVLPRLGSLHRLSRRGRRHAADHGGAAGRDGDEEFHAVRDLRAGEALRLVLWKQSARRGRLLTRELRGEPLPAVHVVLGTRFRPGLRGVKPAFEHAVSLAATLVEHHLRLGHPVRLTIQASPGVPGATIVCGRGVAGLLPSLSALASVQIAPAAEDAPAPGGLPPTGPRERMFFLCVGEGRAVVPPPGSDVRVLDVMDRGASSVFRRARRSGRGIVAGVAQ